MSKAPNNYQRSRDAHSNDVAEGRALALRSDLRDILGETAFRKWWADTFEQDGKTADSFTWKEIVQAERAKYGSLPAFIHTSREALRNAENALGNHLYSVEVHIYKPDLEKETSLRKAAEAAEAQYMEACNQYQSSFYCDCNGANRNVCPCCAHT
jgi:hypothetical protein